MREKPGSLELVLSGKGLSNQIIDRADLATEMVVTKGAKRTMETPLGNQEYGKGFFAQTQRRP